jgi:hypothetical protein
VLTESQLAALEKAKGEKEAHGEYANFPIRFQLLHSIKLVRPSWIGPAHWPGVRR